MNYRRNIISAAVLILLVLALSACASSREAAAPSVAPQAPAPAAPPAARAPSAGVAQDAAGGNVGNFQAQADPRLIIRTGEISIVVEDAEKTRAALQALVEGIGGYVATANLFRDGEQLRGTVTIRFPAAQFDAMMQQVKELGIRHEGQRVNSQDVTEEFTDLSARLRNLEATENELRLLLARTQERGGRAEDIMAVYRELTRIREEIERLKGRMNYIEKSVAMATLTVTLLPNPAARPVVDETWAPLRTLREASRGLVRTLQFLANLAIWLVVWALPIFIVVGLPLWLVFKGLRRLLRWRRPPSRPKPTETA